MYLIIIGTAIMGLDEGFFVHIKDNVSFGSDDTIRTATADGNGEFYTTWQ